MKLAKALKEKNRLVGEINRLRNIIARENSRESRNTSKVDVATVSKDLDKAMASLAAIKTAIAKANVGIYEAIETMAEKKSHIQWLSGLNTQDGIVEQPGYGGTIIKQEFKAFLKKEDIDSITKQYQDEIAALQDQIDEYNATNSI